MLPCVCKLESLSHICASICISDSCDTTPDNLTLPQTIRYILYILPRGAGPDSCDTTPDICDGVPNNCDTTQEICDSISDYQALDGNLWPQFGLNSKQ